MNKKVIYEVGKMIHVLRKWNFKKLSPEEITNSYEYKVFKEKYPELCKLIEEEK